MFDKLRILKRLKELEDRLSDFEIEYADHKQVNNENAMTVTRMAALHGKIFDRLGIKIIDAETFHKSSQWMPDSQTYSGSYSSVDGLRPSYYFKMPEKSDKCKNLTKKRKCKPKKAQRKSR